MAEIKVEEQIAELRREQALRKNVYPKFISSGKMKQAHADYQMACMSAAITSLEYLRDNRDVIVKAVRESKA